LLFIQFMEYVIKHPGSFDINRLNMMCRHIHDEICNHIR